jgi:hypothetical protein
MRVYRASGLGGCMKAQIAHHLDYRSIDTSKQMEKYANEGELHEQDVIRKLRTVTRQQEEVRLKISPAFDVVGHIDGVWVDHTNFGQPEFFVLEVKSMGKDPFAEFKRKGWDTPGHVQRYKWQISVYMLATGLPCKLVVKNRDNGEWHKEIIEVPFHTSAEIILRVVIMERMVRKGELPDECDVNNFPCPYFYLESVEAAELAEDEILDALAEMYEEARLDVKVAEARQKEARKALDAGMGDREKVETEKVKVTYYQRKGSRFDVSKAREELGNEKVEAFMTPTQFKGMRVTIKEDRGRDVEVEAGGTDEPGGDDSGSDADQ